MEIKDFEGLTFTSIEGMKPGSDTVTFTETTGRVFEMRHNQECCENVELEDVCGDPKDLIGIPILRAYESNADIGPKSMYDDSYTWTFYRLWTQKGAVVLRWYGTSNGYYSESVSVEEEEN